MEFIERMADKIIPTLILVMVGALFTMYMDIESLKSTAIDYKIRADKAHEEYNVETRKNREALIRIGAR